jgi:hypothetical protein
MRVEGEQRLETFCTQPETLVEISWFLLDRNPLKTLDSEK